MGKKIRVKSSIFGFSAKKEKQKLMTQIAEMLDDDDFAEALSLLHEAVKKYPNEERFWEMYGYAGSQLSSTIVMQRAFAKLVHFQPNDADVWYNLAVVYAMDMYPSLAMRAFREFARRFPFDSRTKFALESVEVLEKEITGLLTAYKIPVDDEGFKIAVLHDRIQLYMHHSEFEKAIKTAEEAIKKAPDFIAPYNNLSLVYFMSGNVEKALETAELTLEKQPENYHALGNAARYSAFIGKWGEARAFAERLLEVERNVPDIYDKKIETFAYLGDDESLVEVYKKAAKKKITFNQEGFIKNLAAFSFYQLGKEKKAEKLWEEAFDDDSETAEENLSQLDLPVYNRDMIAFDLNYWLPAAYVKDLIDISEEITDDDFDETLKKKVKAFMEKNPQFPSVLPMILERSSLSAKEFMIKLAEWSEHPQILDIIRDFALGQKGSDKIRNRAALALSVLKAIPKSCRMWIKGKWIDVNLMGFNITLEPVYEKNYPMKPEAKELLAEGIHATHKENNDLAEQSFKRALEIEPDHPVLLNNLMMTRERKGEKFDRKKETEELHRRFPDYFFSAVTLARLELNDGNLEKAKEIAESLQDREQWHIDEFKLWSKLQIEICIEQKLFDGARSWLGQMRQAEENFDFIEIDEAEYEEIKNRILRAELLEKLPASLEKLLSRKKGKKKK